ncbi:MAG: UPF0179 family protein [Candidatus Methanomethylophilaceae archaeon]|jgi:uncharacterized protein (UPF0179 family)
MMVLITLVSEISAKEGFEFYYTGPMDGCRECRLKSVCLNLEKGSRYRIAALRDQTHDCIETEDKVKVVEVDKISIPAAMQKKYVIEGGMVTFQEVDCNMNCCENWFRCHPPSEISGAKLRVESVEGDLDCPYGENMVSVMLI